ncbi:MAG: LacI family DNA-binding transcriptional regulator [Armatimonadota bacterium]
MTTIADVAAAASVSPSTVSQVMNGRDQFYSEETKRRVLAAIKDLGYVPSAVARALARSRTQTVGVVGERPDDLHCAPMLMAVHELARSYGYHVSLLPPHDDLDQQFADRRFDVVLIARDVSQADDISASIAGSHQIAVAAGSMTSTRPSSVLAACWCDEKGLLSLAEHLAELGHRHVAFLGYRAAARRSSLFLTVAETLGITAVPLPGPLEEDGPALGAATAREALSLHPRPTALVGRTDAVALGAMHAVQEAGLRVPEDISIAGYYDFNYSAYLSPALTTVYTPFKECAVAVLTEALEALESDPVQPPPPRLVEFPTQLQVRGSTGPPPA